MATSTRSRRRPGLTVAVTGPTGTFGAGLLPLLEREPRIGRVVGIARRPFDPAARGWTRMTYRRGDVRDPAALAQAFAGADVVVHLAFLVTGAAGSAATRAINVEGTLNAYHAAVDAGATRFVYASSVAAYGFHADNPVGITEDWPVRPATHLFYAREKAEIEVALREEQARRPGPALYVLRPPIVVGPHAVGAKATVPPALAALARSALSGLRALPMSPFVVPTPDLPLQLVHEDDVGRALLLCILGAGPPGAYNISGDGVVTTADLARELGLQPLPFPRRLAQGLARTVAGLPLLPPAARWVEALSHPAIMDTTRARTELGWSPRWSSRDALRDTVGRAAGDAS